jgi:hypothetical protein
LRVLQPSIFLLQQRDRVDPGPLRARALAFDCSGASLPLASARSNEVSSYRVHVNLPKEMRMPALQPGAKAPEFSLASHCTDQPVALNAYKGRKTVVAFMPFAFTGG